MKLFLDMFVWEVIYFNLLFSESNNNSLTNFWMIDNDPFRSKILVYSSLANGRSINSGL